MSVEGPLPSRPISVGLDSAASLKSTTAAEATHAPAQARAAVLRIVSSATGSYASRSDGIWSYLTSEHCPYGNEIKQKLDSLQKNSEELCKLLNAPPPKGWKDKIAELEEADRKGDPTARQKLMQLEASRQAVKGSFEELIALASSSLGLPPSRWEAFGTPGYRSDIDNVCTPSPQMSECDQMLTKVLFDTGWMHGLRGLSGSQADLETYLMHPARSRDSTLNLRTPQAMQKFNNLELTMSYLDMRRAYGSDIKGWEEYKQQQLASFPEPLRPSLREIFADVEGFEDLISKEIKEFTANETDAPNAQEGAKRAAMAYKTQRLITLSKQIDENKQELEGLTQQLAKLSPTAEATRERARLMNQIERCEMTIVFRLGMRNALFDESYLTRAAYLEVCEAEDEDAQIPQRRDELVLGKIGTDSRMTDVRHFALLSASYERKETLKREAPLHHVTVSERIFSARENHSKFKSKMMKYQHKAASLLKEGRVKEANEIMQHAAIESAKYAKRTALACLRAMTEVKNAFKKHFEDFKQTMEKLQIPPDQRKEEEEKWKKIHGEDRVEAAYKEAVEMLAVTGDLEKCKRQFVVGSDLSAKLIKEALGKEDKAIDEVLRLFEPPGSLSDRSLLPMQKYTQALAALGRAGVLTVTLRDEKQIKEISDAIGKRGGIVGKFFMNTLSPSDRESMIQMAIEQSKRNESLGKETNVETLAVEMLEGAIKEAESALKETEGARKSPRIVSREGMKRVRSFDNLKDLKEIYDKTTAGKDLKVSLVQPRAMRRRGVKQSKSKDDLTDLIQSSLKTVSQKVSHDTREESLLKKAKSLLYQRIPAEPFLTSSNPRVDSILRARCGFPRETDIEVNRLHEEAEHRTLELHGLTSADSVSGYMGALEHLSNVTLALGLQHGVMVPPLRGDSGLSLVSLWQGTAPVTPPTHRRSRSAAA